MQKDSLTFGPALANRKQLNCRSGKQNSRTSRGGKALELPCLVVDGMESSKTVPLKVRNYKKKCTVLLECNGEKWTCSPSKIVEVTRKEMQVNASKIKESKIELSIRPRPNHQTLLVKHLQCRCTSNV